MCYVKEVIVCLVMNDRVYSKGFMDVGACGKVVVVSLIKKEVEHRAHLCIRSQF